MLVNFLTSVNPCIPRISATFNKDGSCEIKKLISPRYIKSIIAFRSLMFVSGSIIQGLGSSVVARSCCKIKHYKLMKSSVIFSAGTHLQVWTAGTQYHAMDLYALSASLQLDVNHGA